MIVALSILFPVISLNSVCEKKIIASLDFDRAPVLYFFILYSYFLKMLMKFAKLIELNFWFSMFNFSKHLRAAILIFCSCFSIFLDDAFSTNFCFLVFVFGLLEVEVTIHIMFFCYIDHSLIYLYGFISCS